MSRAIPKVKQWRIRVAGHVTKYIVRAPTRRLAVLNFREAYGYCEIVSCGVLRTPYPSRMFPGDLLAIVEPDPQWPTLSRRIAANVDRATVQRIES